MSFADEQSQLTVALSKRKHPIISEQANERIKRLINLKQEGRNQEFCVGGTSVNKNFE